MEASFGPGPDYRNARITAARVRWRDLLLLLVQRQWAEFTEPVGQRVIRRGFGLADERRSRFSARGSVLARLRKTFRFQSRRGVWIRLEADDEVIAECECCSAVVLSLDDRIILVDGPPLHRPDRDSGVTAERVVLRTDVQPHPERLLRDNIMQRVDALSGTPRRHHLDLLVRETRERIGIPGIPCGTPCIEGSDTFHFDRLYARSRLEQTRRPRLDRASTRLRRAVLFCFWTKAVVLPIWGPRTSGTEGCRRRPTPGAGSPRVWSERRRRLATPTVMINDRAP